MPAYAGINRRDILLVSSVLHYDSGIGYGRSVIKPFKPLDSHSDAILIFFSSSMISIKPTTLPFDADSGVALSRGL